MNGSAGRRPRLGLVAAGAVSAVTITLSLVWGALAATSGAASVASRVLAGFYQPSALALDGPDLLVANASAGRHTPGVLGNSVSELNATTGAPVRLISGAAYDFDGPDAILTDGTHIFVANGGNLGNQGCVTELNAATGALVRVLSGTKFKFSGPEALALAGQGLWVASYGNDSLTELNTSSGALVRVISGAGFNLAHPDALAVTGKDLWVANYGANSLTELNASTGALVRVVSSPKPDFASPTALVVSGPDLFVTNAQGGPGNEGSVTELKVSTGSPMKTITGRAYGFADPDALAAAGQDIFVANAGTPSNDGSLTELDAQTGLPIAVLPAAAYALDLPDSLALSGSDLFVADMANGTVTKLALSNGKPVAVPTTTARPAATTTAPAATTSTPAATTTTGPVGGTCSEPCQFTFPQDDENGFASVTLVGVTQNVDCPDPGNCDASEGVDEQIDAVAVTMCAGTSGSDSGGAAIENFSLLLADGTQADQDSVSEDSNVSAAFGNYGALNPGQCVTGNIYFDAPSGDNWATVDFSYISGDFSIESDYLWNV
jgi:sugar lactone lactonase YvrE